MDDRPNPSDGGAHKALLKIPAHQLIQQTPLFHQISQEKLPEPLLSLDNTLYFNQLQGLTGVGRSCYSR